MCGPMVSGIPGFVKVKFLWRLNLVLSFTNFLFIRVHILETSVTNHLETSFIRLGVLTTLSGHLQGYIC